MHKFVGVLDNPRQNNSPVAIKKTLCTILFVIIYKESTKEIKI